MENLQTFQGFNRLKKAAMTAVAYHLNHVLEFGGREGQRELGELREAFEFFDKNQTGTITMEEFQQVIESLWQFSGKDQEVRATLQDLNSNEAKLRELFNGIDFNNTGYIDYSEFLAACLARKEGLRREYAELIFKLCVTEIGLKHRIDRDHEGLIEIVNDSVTVGDVYNDANSIANEVMATAAGEGGGKSGADETAGGAERKRRHVDSAVTTGE